MTELQLVAVDEEGTALLLRRAGQEDLLRLPIDDRLQAALRGDRARLGQLEIALQSSLRPREIQARVRSGESVESVAAAAGVGVERVLRFARPVLDEREHVANQARRLPVRHPGGEGPHLALEEVVTGYLTGHERHTGGTDGPEIDWDAWRREDGRWAVTATWRAGATSRTARWVFDAAGRSVTPDDDAARTVGGERSAPRAATPPTEPRLSVVKELALGEEDATITQPIPVVDRAAPRDPLPSAPSAATALPDEHADVAIDAVAVEVLAVGSDPAAAPPESPERPELPEPTAAQGATGAARPVRSRGAARGRARPAVPSWDEIMFGRRERTAD